MLIIRGVCFAWHEIIKGENMKKTSKGFFIVLMGVFFLLIAQNSAIYAGGNDADIDKMNIGTHVSGADFDSVDSFKGKVVILELWGLQ